MAPRSVDSKATNHRSGAVMICNRLLTEHYSAKVGPKEPRAGKVIVGLHHYKHQPLHNDLATLSQIVVRRGKEIRR